MRYLGGKYRIRKQIVKYLNSVRKEGQVYIEPFLGAAWVFCEMNNPRIGCDAHIQLMSMWKRLQEGWIPPDKIIEDEYYLAKSGRYNDWLTGFIGFGCSWGGKYFGGYAKEGTRNFAKNAKNSLLKQSKSMKDAILLPAQDYRDFKPYDCLIYCDPPYQDTTSYSNSKDFDWDIFWDTMRQWTESNTVVISSYEAPTDFECVLEIPTKTDLRDKTGKVAPRTEKLFQCEV